MNSPQYKRNRRIRGRRGRKGKTRSELPTCNNSFDRHLVISGMPSPARSSESMYDYNIATNEVPKLVEEAEKVPQLGPLLGQLFEKHRDCVLKNVSHHVNLIRSRSPALEDGQITIYDKALLILTRHGRDPEYPPAIHFFCQYYLGVSGLDGDAEMDHGVTQSAEIPRFIEEARNTRDARSASIKTEQDYPESILSAYDHDMEPKLKRLWSVYETARSDYVAVKDDHHHTRLTSAKFLRDTAENTLEYLKGKDVDPLMLTELEGTFRMAKSIVVDLSGGKKRKFDRTEVSDAREARPRPSSAPIRTHYGHLDRDDLFFARNDTRMQESRYRGKPGGRGHSGVPFGYGARDVDSYHPY